MASVTVENYLKAMLALEGRADRVTVSALARHLGVSKPSASAMAKSLAREGLVAHERYRPLRLTEAGRRAAALVVRKHRLTEMFLVERMGFGWDEVHAIAEQVEHVDAPAFFARMDELMGYPTVDPHGSPIPDREGRVPETTHRRLADVPVGQSLTLHAVAAETDELLGYLTRKGIALGTTFHVLEREAFDGSLRVRYGNPAREAVLSGEVAGRLLGA